MKTVLTIATLITLLSTSAHALTQKVDINMHSTLLRGHEQLPLKRMVVRKLGSRSDLQGYKLSKVVLSAKSKHGMAEATLEVNRRSSLSQTVPGIEENFESDYSGFSTVILNAPYSHRGASQGPWKILTRGKIKLNKVSVSLKKQVQYDYENLRNLQLTQVAEFKAGKVLGSTEKVRARGIVKGIQLVGTKGKVRITEVKIKYMDGQEIIVDELNGKLKQGRTKNFALRRALLKPIQNIKVTAATNSLFGSRGKLAIKLAN